MKKSILISYLLFQSFFALAQVNNGTITIQEPTFVKNASIKITTNTTAILTTENDSKTIAIVQENGTIKLKNASDEKAALQFLNLKADQVTNIFGADEKLSPIEQLLNKANEENQRKLNIIPNDANGIENEILVTQNKATGEDPEQESGWAWYWLVLIGVTGVGIGYFLGNVSKASKLPEAIEVEDDAQQLAIVSKEDIPIQQEDGKKNKTHVNINQLKVKYDKLREDNKVLKQSYTDLKRSHKELKQVLDQDLNYYKHAYQDIVQPLQTALDNGDLSNIYKYLTIAAIQYGAITRAKLTKKQNYDITNINTLLKAKSDYNNYPEINSNTPIDQTPVQLRNVISVLKQLGVKNLDNYILQGYKLNDLI
jgi:hypothetical protein